MHRHTNTDTQTHTVRLTGLYMSKLGVWAPWRPFTDDGETAGREALWAG